MIIVREFIKKLEEIKDKDSFVTIEKAKSKYVGKSTIFYMDKSKSKYDYDIVTSEDYSGISIIFFDNTETDSI